MEGQESFDMSEPTRHRSLPPAETRQSDWTTRCGGSDVRQEHLENIRCRRYLRRCPSAKVRRRRRNLQRRGLKEHPKASMHNFAGLKTLRLRLDYEVFSQFNWAFLRRDGAHNLRLIKVTGHSGGLRIRISPSKTSSAIKPSFRIR